jgi:hypothetical protein
MGMVEWEELVSAGTLQTTDIDRHIGDNYEQNTFRALSKAAVCVLRT